MMSNTTCDELIHKKAMLLEKMAEVEHLEQEREKKEAEEKVA